MAKKVNRLKVKKQKRYGDIGDAPGAIHIDEDSLKPVIKLYSYNKDEVQESGGDDFEDVLRQLKACKTHTHWLQIKGLGDQKMIEEIGEHFGINHLVLEDIVNTHQRPKIDDYGAFFFATSRLINYKDNVVSNCQVSFIVKEDLIISFQEDYDTIFDVIAKRLYGGKGGPHPHSRPGIPLLRHDGYPFRCVF